MSQTRYHAGPSPRVPDVTHDIRWRELLMRLSFHELATLDAILREVTS